MHLLNIHRLMPSPFALKPTVQFFGLGPSLWSMIFCPIFRVFFLCLILFVFFWYTHRSLSMLQYYTFLKVFFAFLFSVPPLDPNKPVWQQIPNYPNLTKHNNWMASCLTPEIFCKLKGKKTKANVTLDLIIQTGVDNPGHPFIYTVGK